MFWIPSSMKAPKEKRIRALYFTHDGAQGLK